MNKQYKDFYGCIATITEKRNGRFELKISTIAGTTKKTFDTFRGAKMSMSRSSDGWQEIA